jgi:hypothetical protein
MVYGIFKAHFNLAFKRELFVEFMKKSASEFEGFLQMKNIGITSSKILFFGAKNSIFIKPQS